MASYEELSLDWNSLFQDFTQWTKSDLQLAAELGKTLLERNKELEGALKHHQNVIEDQAQEIEHLQKQTAALREANDSRLRIYEQLEVGIQDLERTNHRLKVENASDKKHMKSLLHNIETLELRCEELGKNLEEAKTLLNAERRKNERLQDERNNQREIIILRHNQDDESIEHDTTMERLYEPNITSEDYNSIFKSNKNNSGGKNAANSTSLGGENLAIDGSFNISHVGHEENDEIIRLMTELETTKKALFSEQQRVAELEDHLKTIIQENETLQSRIAQTSTNEEMKSVHDELSILDEVRQGTMCSRCLRSMDDRSALEEGSSIAQTEDDDDRSLLDLADTSDAIYHSALTIKMSKPNLLELDNSPISNPYRELVEKYEALLEVQRHSMARTHRQQNTPSLNEELLQTSGNYSSIHTKEGDDEEEDEEDNCSGQEKNLNVTLTNNPTINNSNNTNNMTGNNNSYPNNKNSDITETNQQARKNCRRTPTEFSEAETSSSGFSDETSNKATQTDERQGYFLCSIGDGEDCKFSIYDDASPIDSRFRNRPEYRELFKEIFAVLKKAAENKEEGEKLPLLDDTHPNNPTIIGAGIVSAATVNKVPPVTPANEEAPDFGDDTQSIISSAVSEQSVAMSECITKTERKTAKKHIIEKGGQENKPPHHTSGGSGGVIGPTTTTYNGKQIVENGRILTPLKREPLEYLSVGVGIKKKNRKKNRNLNFDRSDSPALPSPPRICYSSGKKRRDFRPFNTPPTAAASHSSITSSNVNRTPISSRTIASANNDWNGSSIIIYNRNASHQSPAPSSSNNSSFNKNSPPRNLDVSEIEFKPSTVSQDLHKLKKLELSYAEVLRRADACKHHHRRK